MSDPVQMSITLHCSREHAFATFTDKVDLWWPSGHKRFEKSMLRLEAIKGGRFVERAENGEEMTLGEIIEIDPPRHISFTWNPGKINLPTLVEVRFTETGDTTDITVHHFEGSSMLGEKWPERAQLFTRGWQAVLRELEAFITLRAQHKRKK